MDLRSRGGASFSRRYQNENAKLSPPRRTATQNRDAAPLCFDRIMELSCRGTRGGGREIYKVFTTRFDTIRGIFPDPSLVELWHPRYQPAS